MNSANLAVELVKMTPRKEVSFVDLDEDVDKAVKSLLRLITNPERHSQALNTGKEAMRLLYNDSGKPTLLESSQPANRLDFIKSYYTDITNGFYIHLLSLDLPEEQINAILRNFTNLLDQIVKCLEALNLIIKSDSLTKNDIRLINSQSIAIQLALRSIYYTINTLPEKEVEP